MRVPRTYKALLSVWVLAGLTVLSASGVARGNSAVVEHIELALLVDGSGSIDPLDFALQKSSYVNALDAELPTDGTVSVGVWLFASSVDEVFPLTVIDSEAAKTSLLDAIESMVQPATSTFLGEAILTATASYMNAGHVDSASCMQIMDASTDGYSNDDADAAADDAMAAGVDQINAVLVAGAGDASFIRGTDSFSVKVASWVEFETAMRGKLARELAWRGLPLPPPPPPVNQPPALVMPPNLYITGPQQASTTIAGLVSDPDGDALTCVWHVSWAGLPHWIVLSESTVIGEGEVTLDLAALDRMVPRAYYFQLTVSDGEFVVRGHTMVIVQDSPPVFVVTGGGTYPCSEDVRIVLGGWMSDYDGDTHRYEWYETTEPWWSGYVDDYVVPPGGEPVALAPIDVGSAFDLGVGTYTYTLRYWHAGIFWYHEVVVIVEPLDTTAPTITATATPGILWPPNHKMVDVIVEVDASDDRDNDLDLTVEVSCNEPMEGLGDGTSQPDYEIADIDLETGIVRLRLRAERSGLGDTRTYTILVTATDDALNASSATLDVAVPHN